MTTTRCCIAGGGPAGMMLGYLLARAGVNVTVLEKHADFLRDFRGDTVHPSTLEVMHELGLLDGFLRRPHQAVKTLAAQIGTTTIQVADFSRLPVHCPFIAFMPQWDFLNFLAEEARHFPNFRLHLRTEAVELIRQEGRVSGVSARSPDGLMEITADLVVAADGRHSTLREAAGIPVTDYGAPMDVLWLRLSRHAADPPQTLGRIEAGRVFITLDRGDYWQCAFVIPKGGFDNLRASGLDAFRAEVTRLAPHFKDRVAEIASWDDVKLLTVAVDRVAVWHKPGLLLIGDAAHAMSPIGGVGINLAIQDAVAAANILAPVLRQGPPAEEALAAVQKRREWPVRMTQRIQLILQKRAIGRVLHSRKPLRPPLPLQLLGRVPALRRLAGRLIGMGVRPEHVDPRIFSPEA
jgi:2-polyprenyl-6-methoxyphenol hydroxylase-like FAD-dependent oxidoreductase